MLTERFGCDWYGEHRIENRIAYFTNNYRKKQPNKTYRDYEMHKETFEQLR